MGQVRFLVPGCRILGWKPVSAPEPLGKPAWGSPLDERRRSIRLAGACRLGLSWHGDLPDWQRHLLPASKAGRIHCRRSFTLNGNPTPSSSSWGWTGPEGGTSRGWRRGQSTRIRSPGGLPGGRTHLLYPNPRPPQGSPFPSITIYQVAHPEPKVI